MRRPPRRVFVASVLASAITAGAVAAAPSVIERIDGSATADRQAVPIERLGDVVVVFDIGNVDTDLAVSTAAAARDAGAAAAGSRGASIGMTAVRRGGAVVQQAPPGYRIPMIVTAMPSAAIAGTMGRQYSGMLGPDTVIMAARTAALRGAQAGDVVDLVAANGGVHTLRIASVEPDDVVGGTELLMNTEAADRLGVVDDTRIVIWGASSRAAIDWALANRGVTTRRETRVVRSWDAPSPDGTLSTARTKELLGEFAYQVTSTGAVNQDAAWQATYLPAQRETLNASIPIRARCHHTVAVDLRAALAEVAAAGLAGAIDVANANTYGGCHNPRFNRISGELGYLSRHSWAMALDTNTVTNCQGCVPKMNCDVVRIFRKHGFAWGGNFLRPDGMHFEWVGEPRDQISTPVSYCPNANASGRASDDGGSTPADSRELLFADQTLAVAHDHVHEP